MERIRAGWNTALWTIDYCCWNETQPRNRIMLLAGPWWWNWHFWGEENGPLLRQSGQHRFPSCSYDAIQKQHKKKKKQYFAVHHWKRNWAVGIKVRGRDYILQQKLNRRGWLKGKDSMIDWLRVLWIMGQSYLGLDRIIWMCRGYMGLGLFDGCHSLGYLDGLCTDWKHSEVRKWPTGEEWASRYSSLCNVLCLTIRMRLFYFSRNDYNLF